jgi:putative transcriptional regulator
MGKKQLKLDKGRLLISEPFLHDPFFKRAVILLTEHNGQGSVGYILNKPINIKLHEAIEEFPEFNGNLYMGGPVQRDSLYYIHTMGNQISQSIEILDGVYWGGNFETVKIMIQNGEVQESELRFFMGYSGWGKEQLEKELTNKSWVVAKANANSVMETDPKILWNNIIKDFGSDYAMLANFPEQPSMN